MSDKLSNGTKNTKQTQVFRQILKRQQQQNLHLKSEGRDIIILALFM